MSQYVEFKRTREFLGRNGVAKMAALLVDHTGDEVMLSPITSRRTIGRACLLIPRDQAREVAKAIMKEAS